MMGDAEAREDRTPDMLGVVRPERPACIDSDLSPVHVEAPSDEIPLIDVTNPLVCVCRSSNVFGVPCRAR